MISDGVSSPSSTITTESPRSNTSCPFKRTGDTSSVIILFKSTVMPVLLVISIPPSKTASLSRTGSPVMVRNLKAAALALPNASIMLVTSE